MSFRSMLQDMKGEFGSMKGLDAKFGYGLRSRSQRVVQDSSMTSDALKQSCWANMPPELLRDVLMRIEESECTWPPRQNVVACAGVCRSWREIMKEIVRTLEVSSKLTFPISLKQFVEILFDERGKISGAAIQTYFLERSRVCQVSDPEINYHCFYMLCAAPKEVLRIWFLLHMNTGCGSTCVRFGNYETDSVRSQRPGPRNTLIQCFIKRDRRNQTYRLYLNLNQASNDDGKFLLIARRCKRPTYTDYIISLNADNVSKGSSTYIGKLRSNFLGTKFIIYDAQPPIAGARVTKSRSTRLIGMRQVAPRVPAGNYPVAHISYELNVLGSRGPRRMQCVMDAIPASAIGPGGMAPTQTEFLTGNLDSFPSLSFFRSTSTRTYSFPSGSLSPERDERLVLKNKAPRWHEQLQCWCLNFNGRVTVASVKNFQLVVSNRNGSGGQELENVILQFGKVGTDVFTMDYQYPISAFQAFAICLSSFDTKIACE